MTERVPCQRQLEKRTSAENIAMIARIANSQADLIKARTGDKYADTIKAFRDQAAMLGFVERQITDTLEKVKTVLDGLMCMGCKKQGAELADGCCRDADCDAGFYGINADEVKAALDAINTIRPPRSLTNEPCFRPLLRWPHDVG